MRILLIIMLPLVAFSYEWASPQIVGVGLCGYSRFALDCYNGLWCIFNTGLLSDTIRASYYANSEWSEPMFIYAGIQASGVGGFDATTAKDGKLWVLTSNEYAPVSPPHITLYYDGSVWSDTFVISGATNFHLAADSIDKVWAVFDGFEDYRILCDVCVDTIWSGPYVVCSYPTYDQVVGSCITIDPNDIRWVGAIALTSPMSQIFLCYSDSTGVWSDSLIMGPQTLGHMRDITSDNDGRIWIAWCDGSEDKIYTAYLDTNLRWSPYYQITQSSGEFYGWCKMAVDSDNKIWIVYDKGNNFYYRVWEGIEWSLEDTIVASPASSAFHGDIFYDHIRDRIWVSFRYGTGYAGDIYATWTNPSSAIAEEKKEPINHNILTLSNPVKDEILIKYTIGLRTKISLNLYDNSGRLVKTIFDGEKAAGTYYKVILLKNYPNGVYYLLMKTSDGIIKRKIVVLK